MSSILHKNIQYARKHSDIGQQELSDKIGVSRKTISVWENGKGDPSVSQLFQLSEIFKIPVGKLLTKDIELADYGSSSERSNVYSFDFLNSKYLVLQIPHDDFSPVFVAGDYVLLREVEEEADFPVEPPYGVVITQDHTQYFGKITLGRGGEFHPGWSDNSIIGYSIDQGGGKMVEVSEEQEQEVWIVEWRLTRAWGYQPMTEGDLVQRLAAIEEYIKKQGG